MGVRKGIIVVVDDEFAIAETLRDLLEDEGYEVHLAGNGKEGLEQIRATKPELILTDVMMPVMGGLDMVSTIKGDPVQAEIPVIMMSSAPRAAALQTFRGDPTSVSFLRKPFDLALLLSTVEQLLSPKK